MVLNILYGKSFQSYKVFLNATEVLLIKELIYKIIKT